MLKGVMLRWLSIFLLVAVAVTAVTTAVRAQDDVTYEDLLAEYGEWTREDVEAAGYVVQPVCIDAAAAGLPAELGGMGFHAINEEHVADGVVQGSRPDVIMLDENDQVIGVEYEIHEVVEPAPTVAGHPLEYTPPHHGMEYDHMSLHVFFVGDEAHRFGTWNPAVTCPADATAAGAAEPASPETLPVTGSNGANPGTSIMWYLTALLIIVGVLVMGFGILHGRHRGDGQHS